MKPAQKLIPSVIESNREPESPEDEWPIFPGLVDLGTQVTLKLGQARPRVAVIAIGPDQARLWLAREHKNNRRTKNNVKRYTEQMLANAWTWSPEPIVLSSDGTLINGGNRLRAIVASQKTLYFTVWFDCPTEVFAVLDSGASRTLWQREKMSGGDDPQALYQMARMFVCIDTNNTVVADHAILSVVEALRDPWRDLAPILSAIRLGRSGLRMAGNAAVCLAWIRDPDVAMRFATEVRDASSHEKAPGNAVRIFIRWYQNASVGTGTYASRYVAFGVASAIRQFSTGTEVSYLKPSPEGWRYWRGSDDVPGVLKPRPA